MSAMLDLHDITVFRAGYPLVSDLNVRLSAGECVILTGPNGVGKTTFLKMLAGLHPDWVGRLTWNGFETRHLPQVCRLALVGHQNAVKLTWTPEQNLRQWCPALSKDTIHDALDTFGLLRLANVPCQHLSAGQVRRVALARLKLQSADIWVLDEPGVSLDQAGRHILSQQIDMFCQGGGLAVVVTHGDVAVPHARNLVFSRPSSSLNEAQV